MVLAVLVVHAHRLETQVVMARNGTLRTVLAVVAVAVTTMRLHLVALVGDTAAVVARLVLMEPSTAATGIRV